MNATKKPKSKHIHKDVPSLFFILSSFRSGKSTKKASLAKSNTNNGEADDEKYHEKKQDDAEGDVINCDKVLQSIHLCDIKMEEKTTKLAIQLPDLSQSATSNCGDSVLSPESGWWVSPTFEEDYDQSFNLWDEIEDDDAN